jgi:undecaprenyl-diphosphatase
MHAPTGPIATVEAVPTRKHLLAAALAALIFLLLARWVLAGESMRFDLWIRSAVHAWASPVATNLLLTITMLGSEWVMLPLGAMLFWRLETIGRRRQALLLAVGSLGGELVSHLLKLAFRRARPVVFFGLPPAETYSFPSGHAFVGTVFYVLLADVSMTLARSHRQRAGIAVAALLMVLAIGFSRVYLGYHYPSDVLGGWTCALGWLALCGPPINAARKRQKQPH